MEKRYSDPTSDAARIAGEVVALGYGTGWSGDVPIAAAVEAKLAPFNIGLRGAVWVHVSGGTTWLSEEYVVGLPLVAESTSNGEDPMDRGDGSGQVGAADRPSRGALQ